MNKHLFSHLTWKLALGNRWRPGATLIALVLALFLVGCTNANIKPEGESFPGESNQPQTPASQAALTSTPVFTWTATAIPTLTPMPDLEATSTSIANTPTSTWTPTTAPSATPTTAPSPELLVVAVEVQQKGEADEVHEIWLVDTSTEEKRLVFTTTPGTRLTQMMWGGEQSDILYVAEMKGLGEGYPTWQLYEVNYETGSSRAFFAEPMEGAPSLLDLSTQGKWLRISVNYFEPISFEWWFINTGDGTVIKNDPADRYLSGFVWSPNEPDVFAYSQESTIDEAGRRIPQSVVISEVTNFEVLDTIKYRYTNWGGTPLLMWDMSMAEQILFFTLGEMYVVDLTTRQWTQIAEGLDVFPGDGRTQLLKSPSGQWAVTTTFTMVIQLNDTLEVVKRFGDELGQRRKFGFRSWYGDRDWIVLSAGDGIVQVYELGGDFKLLREINLNDYGLASPEAATILAKPLQ
ncbi:MAG: hypothetical protein H6662_00185 [Ardenticatenaceae bacterium]|nr:hypothetical protein [Anaerolineales bacterium]MCB8919973.1 hypothetical protein [Ardenticatenaceae bacterium]